MKTFTKVQVFKDEESPTASLFRPLIKLGIWCGFIGLKVDLKSHHTVVKVLHWIYMIGIQLLILFTVFRYCFVLFAFSSHNGRFLAVLSAQALFLSFGYMSLLTSYSLTTSYAGFCKLMDTHKEKYGNFQKEDFNHKFNKYVGPLGIPIVVSLCVTFYSISFLYRDSFKLYHLPLDTDIPWQDAVAMTLLILYVILHISHSAIIYVLFMVMWFLFANEFDHIDHQLKDVLIERKLVHNENQIEKLRQQFISLLECFSFYNSLFKHCIAATLSVFLPCVCFWLYGVIRTEQTREEFVVLTIFMLLNFIGVFIILVLGAALNSKAHQPIAILNEVDVLHIDEKTSRSVSMFLARLLGPPIGFTNYGLFTLDPPAILSIFGTLITYAVVILQFADTAPTGTTVANNSCSTNSTYIMTTLSVN